ncbi:hypothetical protein L249_5175 [Ophiocordyceps polyrhachis-furcata BCC 54312]|uniref:Fe2OG dioxygenase domain-containing protein n=1 Tax=Ophiocordyceps polyrhachis-furcata BCC 54312 TaxID=1330021 RepID=A0A367L8H8_9HYPO|nr:hypothetical protein L249_5175 [Ophiocordyceps polyrhachis-furcata BCC 54312]
MAQLSRPFVAADRFLPTFLDAVKAQAVRAPAMPPGFSATIGQLQTFTLPLKVTGSLSDRAMAEAMMSAWQRDGILQISKTRLQQRLYQDALASSRHFFDRPLAEKQACVDSRSYSGYVASGEEITDGIRDYSEIFTVTKDLPLSDERVLDGWPCHGPCPWPNSDFKEVISRYMKELGACGERLLQLIELGLDVPAGSLTRYTTDGWHHARGKSGRGIGSHTDYGLLVMGSQDEVGGLFVRPPREGETFMNWQKSAAGAMEDDDGWMYVPPVNGTITVFPGDIMQYLTNHVLRSTPHKVGLNTRQRFSFAYFHEPNFSSTVKPLSGYDVNQEPVDGINYGTHFTKMCLRNYPDRITTRRLLERSQFQC